MPPRRTLAWVAILYFAEGLPFGIAYDVWPAFFRVHGVSLREIGLMSLLMLPYTLKPAWAPLVDRFGSRRVWVAAAEFALAGWILTLSALDASRPGPLMWAVLLAFTLASATQDIAIDAYTVDVSTPATTGKINGVRVSAYRIALVASGGLLMVLAEPRSWRALAAWVPVRPAAALPESFAAIAGWRLSWGVAAVAFVGLGVAALATPRVERTRPRPSQRRPGEFVRLRAGAVAAFAVVATGAALTQFTVVGVTLTAVAAGLALGSFLDPDLLRWALRWEMVPVLLFVPLYKIGDTTLGRMVKPFWVDRGLTLTEIGLISTTLGVALTIAGALAGGWFVDRFGIFRGLLWLGIAQSGVNFGYVAVAALDLPRGTIYAASMIESFGQGLGTAAFLSFLMNLCDREHAAGQYALLSALFALTRDVSGAFSGIGVERFGYAAFFTFTAVIAIPGLLLLPFVRPRIREKAVAPASA